MVRSIWRIIKLPFVLISRWLANIYRNTHQLLTEEPEDEPLPDTFAKTIENPMGVLEHLDALRKHLLRAVVFLVITTTIAFIFSSQLLDLLAQPVGGIEELIAIDVTEPISVIMRISLLAGFAMALPYIMFEMWLFIAPGLKKDSRIFSLVAIPIGVIFFFGGMLFAYFIMLPAAIPFLVTFMGIPTQLRPSNYVRFVTGIMFWLGLAFEFPLLIYVLARIGLIQGKQLLEHWRLAIVIIAILAAAITPTIDPVNMALVMGPLIGLYFLSIALAFLARRGKSSSLESPVME
jgi:sec-independent protein translocase protein TatC